MPPPLPPRTAGGMLGSMTALAAFATTLAITALLVLLVHGSARLQRARADERAAPGDRRDRRR